MLGLHIGLKIFRLFGIIILASLLVLHMQTKRLNELVFRRDSFSLEAEEKVLANLQIQLDLLNRIPTFGLNNLIADWTFLQFLQYFGADELRAQTGYGLSPDYFESILPKDPYYTYFYLFLSGSSSIYAGQPDRTVSLMNEGLSYMTPQVPDDGYLVWRYKGTDELLFLGDSAAAQQSFQTAADWAYQSSQPEAQAVAEISERTANFLSNNPVSKRAQVNAWASILSNSFDESTQQLAIDRIEALGGRVNITEDGQVQIGYPQQD